MVSSSTTVASPCTREASRPAIVCVTRHSDGAWSTLEPKGHRSMTSSARSSDRDHGRRTAQRRVGPDERVGDLPQVRGFVVEGGVREHRPGDRGHLLRGADGVGLAGRREGYRHRGRAVALRVDVEPGQHPHLRVELESHAPGHVEVEGREGSTGPRRAARGAHR